MAATHAPLMQIIEHGFIRNDAMPARAGEDQKQVFNSSVAATLSRYGFAPGAAFRDVMHFLMMVSGAPRDRRSGCASSSAIRSSHW
jgi:hypothetical protein